MSKILESSYSSNMRTFSFSALYPSYWRYVFDNTSPKRRDRIAVLSACLALPLLVPVSIHVANNNYASAERIVTVIFIFAVWYSVAQFFMYRILAQTLDSVRKIAARQILRTEKRQNAVLLFWSTLVLLAFVFFGFSLMKR
jgi:hypothetical protein